MAVVIEDLRGEVEPEPTVEHEHADSHPDQKEMGVAEIRRLINRLRLREERLRAS